MRRVIFERYPATLQLVLLALLVCMAIAIPAGALAAHRRGTAADRAIGVLTLFGLAVPNLALGPLLIALFSIELGWLPVSGRGGALHYILPAVTLGAALAARSLGASPLRIMIRHLLPNMIQPVLVQATIGMVGAILAEATLSFLGLGVLAPIPSWGAMLNDARNHLFDAPHMVVFPALAVVLAVLAFNLLGDAWRDWLDPRTRSQMAAVEQSR